MRQQLAKWNPSRDVWEVETQDLFSEHLDVFSETWPISGSMRNGAVFRPPTLERPIGDYASSCLRGIDSEPGASDTRQDDVLFRTPCAAEVDGGALTPEQAKERGQTLRLAGQVEAEFGDLRTLPTPLATDGTKGGPNQRGSKGDLTLSSAVHQMLPTPDAYAGARGGTQHPDKRREGGHSVALGDVVEHQMLPTPKAADGDFGLPRTTGRPAEKSTHLATRVHYTDFGDYAAAVQRWEDVTGRPAPAPTEINPDKRKRCAVHAVPPEARSREELRDVRDSAAPQEICERTARRQERVPAEEALLPIVREHEEGRREERSPLASTPDAGERVRGVRDGRGPTRAPSGPEYCEQHPGELGDALRELPPTAALAGGPREAPGDEPLGDPCTCGRPRLSAKFTEWMMGLPAGWFTDPAIGLTRQQQFRIAGNGVVPQQGHAALAVMLDTALTEEETA